ncbi:hypothetical protein T492DRAFT_1081614 [Pavlovales sp. CCMP2436]|nr:hypothetical protein T492DRAFT_1081614 [Pavlovales sp. CCMP2436]
MIGAGRRLGGGLLGRTLLPHCHALSTVTGSEARTLLGLAAASSHDARSIKAAYYQQALRDHPDLNPLDLNAGERFARVVEACELLLEELEHGDNLPGADDGHARTGTREAPRADGAGTGGGASEASQQRARYAPRKPTAAEVILMRLDADPAATASVWAELSAHKLAINSAALDQLFRACGCARRDEALAMFEQAAPRLAAGERSSALVSLLSWCHEESATDWTFTVVNLCGPDDLTPEVQATLARTFSYFPSGASF